MMRITQRSLRRLTLASVTLSLCFVSTAVAQETQRDDPQPPKIIRKSGGVLQGSATRRVEPAYPPLAKAARISGSVVVEMTVDEEGNVISARAISGHPLLKDAAVSAARGWRFAQTQLQGVPVKVIGTITFNFTLGDDVKDLTRQIEDLKQQIAATPNSAELHFQLGKAYRFNDQEDSAIEEYNKALQLKPDYGEVYSWLGSTYKSLNQYEKAIEAFQRALDFRSEGAQEIHMQMARTYLRLNRTSEALESATQALSLKPDFLEANEAHTLIGLVLLDQRRYNEALNSFKEAAKISPGISEIHLYLGMTYVMIGDRELAINEYQILKEKDATMAEQLLKRINNQQ